MSSKPGAPSGARRFPVYPAAALLLVALCAAGLVGAQGRDYRIGAGDVLKITVWGHEDLTRTSVVAADGRMPFPLIGDVPVASLNPTQLEVRLRELLGVYVVDPQVTVVVQEFRSQKVFVLGEAEKPGTYPLTGGQATLLDILSQAGGPSKTAGRQVIIVRFPRSEEPVAPGAAGSRMLRSNLKALLDGDARENVALESGDTIYIPKMTSFFVLGEVKRPGAFTLEKDTTVLEAITLAGGFTERSAPSVARVLRKRPDGTQESVSLDLSGADPRARDFLLSEADTVLVPAGNSFYVLGEVRKPGSYQLEQAVTAIEGIALAGGFTERAAPNRTKIIRTHKDGRQETLIVDLNEVLKRGRKDKDVTLTANDVIVVPESFF